MCRCLLSWGCVCWGFMCHNMSFTSLMSLYVNGVSMGVVSFHVRSMSTYVVVCKTYSNKQPKVLSLGGCGGGVGLFANIK